LQENKNLHHENGEGVLMKEKKLGTFMLAMITVATIVSLRNLPLSAALGFESIFYFVISALVFFIPIALVVAELATGWPHAGGTYIWVGEAFGKKWGFFALWLSWVAAIVWFPTILAFTAAMIASLLEGIFPSFLGGRYFSFGVMLIIFWGMTFLNFLGIKTSGWFSCVGTILGTLIPGSLIIG